MAKIKTDRLLVDDNFSRWFKSQAALRKKTHPEFSRDLFMIKDKIIKDVEMPGDLNNFVRINRKKRSVFNEWKM